MDETDYVSIFGFAIDGLLPGVLVGVTVVLKMRFLHKIGSVGILNA